MLDLVEQQIIKTRAIVVLAPSLAVFQLPVRRISVFVLVLVLFVMSLILSVSLNDCVLYEYDGDDNCDVYGVIVKHYPNRIHTYILNNVITHCISG